MKRVLALLAVVVAAACTHEQEAQVAHPGSATVVQPGTHVTVVQQTTAVVQQTIPVHVHYGRGIDCDMMCRNTRRACDRSCVPTAWSPNMQSIADHCSGDCRFNEFACVGDCVRSGGHSRTRGR